jgi:hypothetical protein
MRRRRAGPVISWIIAGVLVVAPYVLGARLAPDTQGELLALNRIHDGSVVFIGSSLTRCAVPYDARFAALAAAQSVRLDFVRITLPSATQEDFSDVIDRIGVSGAGLVLVEAEMLLQQPDRRLQRLGISGLAYAYMSQVRALWVELGLKGSAKSENTGDRECKLLDTSASPRDLDRLAESPHAVRGDRWLAPFRAMRASGRIHGTKVVIVSLGRSAGLEARLAPAFRAAFAAALRNIQGENKIDVWVFPSQRLPDADYSDGGHLNARGRAEFTRWLIQRLADANAGN